MREREREIEGCFDLKELTVGSFGSEAKLKGHARLL